MSEQSQTMEAFAYSGEGGDEGGKTKLRQGAITSTWYTTVYGLSLIGPTFCTAGLIAFLAARTGINMSLSMILSGLFSLTWAVGFGVCAKIWPQTGGIYRYIVGQFKSRELGFLIGSWFALYFFVAGGVSLAVAGIYLNSLLPGVPIKLLALLVALFNLGISIVGIKIASRVAIALFLTEAVILLVLSFSVIAYVQPSASALLSTVTPPGSASGWSALFYAAVISVFNFIGFCSITELVEESSPNLVAKGAVNSVIISTVIYAVALIGVPLFWLGRMEILGERVDPLVEVAQTVWSGYWWVIVVGITISAASTNLACINSGARYVHSLGRDGCLSKAYAWVHPRYRTPVLGLVTAFVTTSLSMYFFSLIDMINEAVISVLFGYFFVSLISVVHTWRWPLNEISIWKHRVAPVIGMAVAVYLGFVAVGWEGWRFTLPFMIVIFGWMVYLRMFRKEALARLELDIGG